MQKRGRPLGSRNVQRTPVEMQPVRCPHCFGTDTVDRRLLSRSYRPGTALGYPYTHVARYALRCRGCGAQLEVILHEYVLARNKQRTRMF